MSHDFPTMLAVQQRFEFTPPVDFKSAVSSGFELIKPRLKPGMSVAVGVGSRGISNLSEIVSLVIAELKKTGMKPFIIPAMGSHGGATPEGQMELLAGYGLTEESMGVSIRPSMEVAPLGVSAAGREVLWSREAIAADGVFVINRVKPHTDFNGLMGSGLTKMLVVRTMVVGESVPVIPGFFSLTHVHNRGAAFGLLADAGAAWQDRFLFFHRGRWPKGANPDGAKFNGCAVRNQRFRFVNNRELYDMQADPKQKTDVAAAHPDVVREMREAYDVWWRETRPLMVNEAEPVFNEEWPFFRDYNAQLEATGIPDWNPPGP